MAIRSVVRPKTYFDSVVLMRAAAAVSARSGVRTASLVMGTPANKAVLADAGLLDDGAATAGPNDLIIVVDADEAVAADALAEAESSLVSGPEPAQDPHVPVRPRSLAAAASIQAGANLALISVPGPYAASEALKALRLGMNVFLFSDNVPVADEIMIKDFAERQGLLVMGPDCGTAVVAGVPLGFANELRRGTIGLAGASGTGLQQVSVLIDRWGAGVSHILGTGSHDVSAEVNGRSTLAALAALSSDDATQVVVLVSKPPSPTVASELLEQAAGIGKPVVACFLGTSPRSPASQVTVAATLEEAARAAVRAAGMDAPPAAVTPPAPPAAGRVVRGLYTGGTFASEASTMFGAAHAIVDLGADEFTVGRPHPMIDPSLRMEPLREALAAPDTALVLLDVVGGYGACGDPVGALLPVLDKRDPAGPPVIAFVVATESDPLPRSVVERQLEKAGAVVAESSTAALRLAAATMTGTAA